MKILTAVTAAAALAVGIMAANAAETNTSNANNMATGTVMGSARFCDHTKGGAMECNYTSIEECDKVAKPAGGTCVENPKTTTGSGINNKK